MARRKSKKVHNPSWVIRHAAETDDPHHVIFRVQREYGDAWSVATIDTDGDDVGFGEVILQVMDIVPYVEEQARILGQEYPEAQVSIEIEQ